MAMRKLKKYIPTKFKAKKSVYDKDAQESLLNLSTGRSRLFVISSEP